MPVMTRSVHDLVDAVVARDPSAGRRRRSTAARRSTRSTRPRWPPPTPDLILTQELCEVCAVSYREVNEVARAIDARHHGRLARADLDRGHPQHDLDGRRDDRGRGRRGRPRRVAARAARRDRGEGPGAARRRAAGRRGSSASSGSIRRSRRATGSRSRSGGRAAGSCSARDGDRSVADDLGRGRRGRPGDAPADAVRLPPRARPSAEWARTPRPARLRRPDRGPPRPGLRARRVGLLQPARSAGHRRHRAAGRDLRPGRASSTSRRSGRGRRSGRRSVACRSARRSTACGAGRSHVVPRAGRPRGLGAALLRTASARPATTGSCGSGCARR